MPHVKQWISHFLYPPLCIHCQALLPKRIPVLCSFCLEQISLASADERCPSCFAFLQKGRCDKCLHQRSAIVKQIAACEQMGPAASLIHQLSRGELLAAAPLSSLMAYQWLEYKMPLPDFLLPLPVFFWESFNPHDLLAKQISEMFGVPILRVLKKGVDRKAFLTEGEFHSRFYLKKNRGEQLCDKRLLLIALTLDEAALHKAAQALQPFFPQAIYALTSGVLT